MGSRHSWSPLIVTDATLVSLERMNQVLELDRELLLVRVQAGVTLKQLVAWLDERGLALANLGSITEQTIAGAISTGTHGTGLAFQCLASQVEALALVDGEGVERRYRRGDSAFDAAVVSLGALGVLHELTLRVVPAFQMHAVTDGARFDEVVDRLDEYVRGFDHFKFWWFVPDERVIVYTHQRTTEPRNDSALKRWFKDELLSVVMYRALLAVGKASRAAFIPAINRFLTTEASRRFERVCHSTHGFLTPVPPRHRESEWAFDLAQAKDLLRTWRALLLESGHAYNFIQEVRFTKADPFWLSPAWQRDSVWLSLYNIDADGPWQDQLERFDAFARAHGGRPHWGKEASFEPAHLAAQYGKLGEFRALMREHDPKQKFVNDLLRRALSVP
jgi:L-gulonolactone oxidase